MSLEQELVKQINSLQKQVDTLVKPEVGRWLDWTPVISQNGAVAKTITYARYIVDDDGKTTVTCKMIMTGAGVAGNVIIVSGLPISAKYSGDTVHVGSATIKDSGTAFYPCTVEMSTATTIKFTGYNTPNYAGATPNFGLAADDIVSFTLVYEKA